MLLLGVVNAARSQREVTAVQQVVNLLESLQDKVKQEGLNEAKTYNEFAKFADVELEQCHLSIAQNSEDVNSLRAALDSSKAQQQDLQTELTQTHSDIAKLKAKMKSEMGSHQTKTQHFTKELNDHGMAISQLSKAILALQQSRSDAFVFVQDTLKTMSRKFSDMDIPVPENNYDFHSDTVLDTLKDLKSSFVQGKDDLEHAHLDATAAHDQAMQVDTRNLSNFERISGEKENSLSETNENIGEKQRLLTETFATLHDKDLYCKELLQKAIRQRQLWQQRSQSRLAELQALVEATTIIKGTVTERDASRTTNRKAAKSGQISLLQTSSKSKIAMRKLLKVSESVDAVFSPMERAVEVLMHAGRVLKSHELSALATQASENPMSQVTQMIEELIQRLLSEQGDEANHKGWCNTELQKVKQKRDLYSRDVQRNSEIVKKTEALRAKLSETISGLAQEGKLIEKALSEASAQRNDQ